MNISEIQYVKYEINPQLPEDYEIKCLTAEGTMGNIYTAASSSTDIYLAIKAVKTNKDKNLISKIINEFNIQHRLIDHRNIGIVFSYKETGIYTIICMELLTGGDLFDLIPFGKGINMNRGYKIYRQMLSAIEYCHDRSIVHMDIKPENIMIDSSGKPKLIDFGLAIDHNNTPFINTYLGTIPYSAPETFMSAPYTGYKADLFSLNITFLTVITGERCWNKASMDDYHYRDWQQRKWTLDIFKRIPTDILNFLMLALAHDPEKRLSTEQIRLHYWYQCAAVHKIKAIKSPSKVVSDRDQPQSQPMIANLGVFSGIHDVPMSQPTDLSSILMPEIKHGEQIVKRMSRFLSRRSISDTFQVLVLVIGHLQHCTIVSNSSNGLTVESTLGGFSVTFRVFVYPFGSSMLVDFRRVKGDGLLFRNVFGSIKETTTHVGLLATDYECLRKVQPPI